MTLVKSAKEIKIMMEGGKKLAAVMDQLIKMAKPGVNLLSLEKKATFLLKKTGGEPAFKRVPGYCWSTCLNVNEEIVHAVPKNYFIKPGDVLNIDIGLFYHGFNTDMSETVFFEPKDKNKPHFSKKIREIKKFLKIGKKTLQKAIAIAKPGKRIGDISWEIQKNIEKAGYNTARNLSGHGIGKKLHEEPLIPCFVKDEIKKTPLLRQGMTLAIEVIYMMGKPDLVYSPDKWTLKTKDGKISAVYEKTIAIGSDGSLVLT